MALLGPVVVVAESPAAQAVETLDAAGAFPVVEASWADAHAAIDKIEPCALVLADQPPNPGLAQALARRIEATSLLTPVLARLAPDDPLPLPCALAVTRDEPGGRLIERLHSALRIRNLHATVLRRADSPAAASALPRRSSPIRRP